MSESIDLHPAQPLARILTVLACRGVRFSLNRFSDATEQYADAEGAMQLISEGWSLSFVTDEASGPSLIDPYLRHGGPEGPALQSVTRAGGNVFSHVFFDAIREVEPVLFLSEYEDPPGEFIGLYRTEEGPDSYLFRLPHDTSSDSRSPRSGDGPTFSVECPRPGSELTEPVAESEDLSDRLRRARSATPEEVEDLDWRIGEDGYDALGLWLPGSKSVVLFGTRPEPWQREEHDAILGRLVAEQKAEEALESDE